MARGSRAPELGCACPPVVTPRSDAIVAVSARLDNVNELRPQLSSVLPKAETDDRCCCRLVVAAYARWGVGAPARLVGDWSFAAWHPRTRSLVLARDHGGMSGLYYQVRGDEVLFASSLPGLVSQNGRLTIDEMSVATRIIYAPEAGDATVYRDIHRVVPAQIVQIDARGRRTSEYWAPSDIVEQSLAERSDYVPQFREHLREAVRSRLPSSGRCVLTLSSGLDSTTIAAVASAVRPPDLRLISLTMAPPPPLMQAHQHGPSDESPIARKVAAAVGIEIEVFNDLPSLSPVAAVRRGLDLLGEPIPGAAVLPRMFQMRELARALGSTVMITGSYGNHTMSYAGALSSQPSWYQLNKLGVGGLARSVLGRARPSRLVARRAIEADLRVSALRPSYAEKLRLVEHLVDETPPPTTVRQRRLRSITPGLELDGAREALVAASVGVDCRLPAADRRLIEFVLSVPDRVFIEPRTDTNRWLLREATKGILPDVARLSRHRVWSPRIFVSLLQRSPDEVEAALAEVARSSAGDVIDLPRMREVWRRIKDRPCPELNDPAETVLVRGLMAGLFLSRF
ncbi:MAG: asparagine synthase-related protein [Acidimicrobiales bacterium]